MSVRITFADLWTYAPSDTQARLPLARLAGHSAHIHGRLSIEIQGKALPCMGYWGPDDVCIGEWVRELRAIVDTLSTSPDARYVYDEGEQGQPAYSFQRQGETVEVSVVDSELGDGAAMPEWGVRVCRFSDVAQAVEVCLANLCVVICEAAPQTGQLWWRSAVER